MLLTDNMLLIICKVSWLAKSMSMTFKMFAACMSALLSRCTCCLQCTGAFTMSVRPCEKVFVLQADGLHLTCEAQMWLGRQLANTFMEKGLKS